jgi:hypothetical protein
MTALNSLLHAAESVLDTIVAAVIQPVFASPILAPYLPADNAVLQYGAAGVLLSLAAYCLLYVVFWRGRGNKRGYGSGENDRWNRKIRTDRPQFVHHRHHKLEHVWRYEGTIASHYICAVLWLISTILCRGRFGGQLERRQERQSWRDFCS